MPAEVGGRWVGQFGTSGDKITFKSFAGATMILLSPNVPLPPYCFYNVEYQNKDSSYTILLEGSRKIIEPKGGVWHKTSQAWECGGTRDISLCPFEAL